MADTINDITIPTGSWLDVYTSTGITLGLALVIQNKSSENILIQINAAQPSASDDNGPVLYRGGSDVPSIVNVDAGENKVWMRSVGNVAGRVNVQEG